MIPEDWIKNVRDLAYLTMGETQDPAHDFAHIKRVVANALRIGQAEGANLEIVLPAAYLHDCVHIAKNSPDRSRASTLAAEKAAFILRDAGYNPKRIKAIAHCIAAHSFSANITAATLEAKVVQDADRLDALGAIGIARCFATKAAPQFYAESDPFCQSRPPEDTKYSVDHFFAKLLKLPETLHTAAAKEEAKGRIAFMESFLSQLGKEIAG